MFDKDKMIDTKGAPITQGLFLETSYGNQDNVLYTLKSRDHKYKGRVLPSIKKLYLEMEDVTEYDFAYEYFLDWDHWKRIRANKLIAKHLEGWQEELEVKMRCNAIKQIQESSIDGSFQASKFLADRGWEKRAPGRPSKEESEREAKIQEKMDDEFAADLARLGR